MDNRSRGLGLGRVLGVQGAMGGASRFYWRAGQVGPERQGDFL